MSVIFINLWHKPGFWSPLSYLCTCSSCMLDVYLMLMLCMRLVHVRTDDSPKIITLANVRRYLIKFHVLHMVTLSLMCPFRLKAASWSCCHAPAGSAAAHPAPHNCTSTADSILRCWASSVMLPGYLWQMPLNRGCSLQAIHGCCGMKLPCWLCPTLPRALEGSIVLPLPARLSGMDGVFSQPSMKLLG